MSQQLATTEDATLVTQPEPDPKPELQPPAIVTAAQAKVNAIADLTMKAYARASELNLTPEEIERLSAEFPDEAFRPGAAGKETLIYIEHAFLRDRLNTVIGVGRWAIVPRSRWAENYRTAKGIDAVRVYVEAMLLVRGCFVAEAVGEMSYYPNNESQNYGDAVEGAKTAALRRCVKELGVGLQAWKKDFCDGWWQRRGTAPARQPSAPSYPPACQNTQPARQSAPPARPSAAPVDASHPVTITEVKTKDGTGPRGPWTVYFCRFSDGREGSTFDHALGATAQSLNSSGEECLVEIKPGRMEGKFDIVSIKQPSVSRTPVPAGNSDLAPDDVPF